MTHTLGTEGDDGRCYYCHACECYCEILPRNPDGEPLCRLCKGNFVEEVEEQGSGSEIDPSVHSTNSTSETAGTPRMLIFRPDGNLTYTFYFNRNVVSNPLRGQTVSSDSQNTNLSQNRGNAGSSVVRGRLLRFVPLSLYTLSSNGTDPGRVDGVGSDSSGSTRSRFSSILSRFMRGNRNPHNANLNGTNQGSVSGRSSRRRARSDSLSHEDSRRRSFHRITRDLGGVFGEEQQPNNENTVDGLHRAINQLFLNPSAFLNQENTFLTLSRLFPTIFGNYVEDTSNDSSQLLDFPNNLPDTIGDYALTQASFDNIISQLLEQENLCNSHPPAPESVISGLSRLRIDLDRAKRQDECVICKCVFIEGDLVIDFPCRHVYHEDCIVSWIRRNGTCPVCRHSLMDKGDKESNNTGISFLPNESNNHRGL